MFLWWKSQEVERLIFQHFNQVGAMLGKCRQALQAYLDDELERAKLLAQQAGDLEGQADDIRRQVELQLLQGALLADSRRDLWEIIERIDKLANVGEALLDFALLQRVELPTVLKPLIEEIMDRSLELVQALERSLQLLFSNLDQVAQATERVEQLEHQIDQLERQATQKLFALDLELAHKILVRDFIRILADISDRGEDVSDLLELAAARRRI